MLQSVSWAHMAKDSRDWVELAGSRQSRSIEILRTPRTWFNKSDEQATKGTQL
jgi:hypothetical protein